MITELVEKFEDIFQPHSPEEVEKRAPKYVATITEVDKKYKTDLTKPKRYEFSLISKPLDRVFSHGMMTNAFDDFLNRMFNVRAKNVKYVRTISLHNTHSYNVKHDGKCYSILIQMKDD
jgi:hypothetical protein